MTRRRPLSRLEGRSLLDIAVAEHKAGRLDGAGSTYERFLARQPDAAPVIRLLGVVRYQQGSLDQALALFERAVARDPAYPDAYRNLGIALKDKGDLPAALTAFEKAVALRPTYAEAWRNLGIALQESDRLKESVEAFQRAIALKPAYADAHMNLGTALLAQERVEEALTACRHAVALKPDLAAARNNLGLALVEDGKLDEGVLAFERAIALRPDYLEALVNLGGTLVALRRTDEGLAVLRRAVARKPDSAAPHRHLAAALLETGQPDEALAEIRVAVDLDQASFQAFGTLAAILDSRGDLEGALAAHRQSVVLRPRNIDAHFGFGLTLLLHGRYDEGLAEYEWRRRGRPEDPSSAPEWNGEDMGDGTLLLHTEQGLGDTIQFARYAPMAAARTRDVVLEAQAPLARLLAESLPGVRVIARGEERPPHLAQHPLMSLAKLFGKNVGTIPSSVPYLRADPERSAQWRERLPPGPYRIGVVWQGNPKGAVDRGRSVPLQAFEPLARIDGVTLVCLQKNHGLEQLADLPPGMVVETLPEDFDAGADAFLDTSAIMQCLDLVISSDTSAAHIAGALGVPAWVVLKHRPDWRWMLGREDSPWYPTLRLFRQPSAGDWTGAFAAMATALRHEIAMHGRTP